ncbi:unnamed protein product [Schistosoma curassoni]|uniref:Transposase n=1 Tax=Schistosoma curassoni TaxID=6186 RepID=A0A183JFN7_9TREM|nr:unnamed protein product [Schistosoma curassoni]
MRKQKYCREYICIDAHRFLHKYSNDKMELVF